MNKISSHYKGFTLIETLVSTALIVIAISGPLTVAVNSSTYTKDTKNQIMMTYLAEEAIELLRQYRDTVFLECLNNDPSCVAQDLGGGVYEEPHETAWRIFKANISGAGGQSCFAAAGCAYDAYDFLKSQTAAPSTYNPTTNKCDYLYRDDSSGTEVFKSLYLCNQNVPTAAAGTFKKTPFTRVINITSVSSASNSYDQNYNDDLRVDVTVSYTKENGIVKSYTVTDFIKSRI